MMSKMHGEMGDHAAENVNLIQSIEEQKVTSPFNIAAPIHKQTCVAAINQRGVNF